jgi:hypothetical protein
MSAMSSLHRAALTRLEEPPRPVFLDTTAGFETNVGAIADKAVEYYAHHLQTQLRVACYRHRDKTSPAEMAAAVKTIRESNLIFAGPGSPTYAIRQWRDSPVWEAVVERFEAGADLLFASAASIALGRYSLPVYEIYKAGDDPFWTDGMDLLGTLGLNLAIVPHFDDSSGGDNYDSRFCYMGAERFDKLQAALPPEVSILGIDAYTAICFDHHSGVATVSGQGGITLLGEAGSRRLERGMDVPFTEFRSSTREVVQTYDAEPQVRGYEFADTATDGDSIGALAAHVEHLAGLSQTEKVDILARLQSIRDESASPSGGVEAPLVELVLELRQALREAKRFDLADKARDLLDAAGFDVQDTPEGARWTRR